VWFESTSNNRIQYAGSNSYVLVAGGANTFTVNATGVGISGTSAHTGAATFSNTVTVTGNATFSNPVTLTGNATFSNTVTFSSDIVPATSYKRNRIINGNMVVDQRNAGASVSVGTAAGTYTLDRWRVYHDTAITSNITAQQSTTVPTTGYINSQILTNGTAATAAAGDLNVFQQRIEGYNVADLNFGSSTASAVTLSFWVRSSLTGTFGVGLSNSAQDRSVASTYTINSANTWEQKTITFSGDQSGTWVTNNGIGLITNFDLGSGTTSNATTAGSLGKLIVDNLNATVSSRASQTSVDTLTTYVDTEVGAIKAKTDNLPANTASQLTTIQTATDRIPTNPASVQSTGDQIATIN
jgi:hypothetical protein